MFDLILNESLFFLSNIYKCLKGKKWECLMSTERQERERG